MLRPSWCNDGRTTLRTLSDWPFAKHLHGDPRRPRDPMKQCYLQNQGRLSNPDQLLLQDLSNSSAADRGHSGEVAELLAKL